MAKLESPLYGETGTGTLARSLAFRRTANPEEQPGVTPTFWGTVAKIPIMSCPPSAAQVDHRQKYREAIDTWNALSPAEQQAYKDARPPNLSGFNFFLKLCFLTDLAYLGYCVYYDAFYQLAPSPDQPAAIDYDIRFPGNVDDFPIMLDGAHSPQAWLYNRMTEALTNVQQYLIDNKSHIEEG